MEELYASKKSIVKFIKTINLVPEGSCICHQTLTFGSGQTSEVAAKKVLNSLLDTVGKRFPAMASLYVMEYNQARVIHFHVLFLFFREEHLPFKLGEMEKKFGNYVFKCWKRIQDEGVNRDANRMRVHVKSPKTAAYLAKSIRPVLRIPAYASTSTRWWGIRRRALFNELGQKPDQKAALAKFQILFPRGVLRPYHKTSRTLLNPSSDYISTERIMTAFSDGLEFDAA